MSLIALPKPADWTLASGLEALDGGLRLGNNFRATVLAEPSLINFWPLDEDLLDKKGSNGGTGYNILRTEGMRGVYARYFNGINSYIDVGSIASNWSQVSFTGWFSTSASGETHIVSKDDNGSNRAFVMMLLNAKFYGLFFGSTSGYIAFETTATFNDGAPHFFRVTFSASNPAGVKVYIDGLDKTLSIPANTFTGSTVRNPSISASIGRRPAGSPTGFWNGRLSNIAIYSSVLSTDFYGTPQYATSSPVAESPWIAIDQNTLDETTAISILENKIAPLQGITSVGNVKHQYALNSGAYNGVWLTHAQLVAALVGQAITDHTNSLCLKAQLNSDGTQAVDISGFGSNVMAGGVSGGGTKGRYAQAIGVKGGYR